MGHIAFVLLLATAAQQPFYGFGLGYSPPIGTVQFLQESGVERWHVRIARKGAKEVKEVHVRISGSGCTFIGEIPEGYVTVLFDNLSFRTTGGRSCQSTATEE